MMVTAMYLHNFSDFPRKRFKINDDDWRYREKWGDYEVAVCDVVDRTSTEIAQWFTGRSQQ